LSSEVQLEVAAIVAGTGGPSEVAGVAGAEASHSRQLRLHLDSSHTLLYWGTFFSRLLGCC
jgi:hypothetical protein